METKEKRTRQDEIIEYLLNSKKDKKKYEMTFIPKNFRMRLKNSKLN